MTPRFFGSKEDGTLRLRDFIDGSVLLPKKTKLGEKTIWKSNSLTSNDMENTTTLPTQKNVPKALSLFFRDCVEMTSVSQCFGHAFASPAVRQKSQTSTLFGNPHFGGFAKGSHVLSAMVGGSWFGHV